MADLGAEPDFDASMRGDAHFLLDPTEGRVSFGDGDAGRVPGAGVAIYAAYRTTQARRVAAYLTPRRLIGTRVEVVGPTYLEVTVRTTVRACEGVSTNALQDRVVASLDEFLDPLTGGPEGTGWPFGRNVYRSDVLQAIDGVSGVDHVLAMVLVANGCEAQCGNVCLSPTWLVAAGRHQIRVE